MTHRFSVHVPLRVAFCYRRCPSQPFVPFCAGHDGCWGGCCCGDCTRPHCCCCGDCCGACWPHPCPCCWKDCWGGCCGTCWPHPCCCGDEGGIGCPQLCCWSCGCWPHVCCPGCGD